MSQPEKLSVNQKKYLRGIAHGLNPMIIIGANGVTDSLMAELDSTLSHHEILKIKIASAEREDRKTIIDHVIQETGALLVQSIGKIFVIYRQNEETQLPLPKK
ncbi:MAG: ribosome assembly RNA-binding protein YhbY [Thiomicrorhabdus chilensis]|uniref:ribosome assembly RNA-binding protein YhbY n=1 Tax=Thiomicrorhabdus chilensis TaxID=63656 RepID=UPI00299D442D|nr:ribosome assembly RNA-binding protein YhbY [Thiomicrorhabdus chilensis]MDX1346852.1 ribosome assembly RNA-binding protein YhbY [Thiomicrorhabdus chilensis]